MADIPPSAVPNAPRHATYGGRGSSGRGSRARGGSRGRGRGRGGEPSPRVNKEAPKSARDRQGVEGPLDGHSHEVDRRAQHEAQGKAPVAEEDEEEEDADVCFICASPIEHHSVAPCNHRTCHVCALRMRALYKSKACLHCRTSSDFVIFTDDAEKRYQDYADSEIHMVESGLGIKYEKEDILEDTLVLLRYNCPDRECTVACLGWPDLHRHVRSVHQKWMCDLCTRNKKVFTHEHELFTKDDLRKHEKHGDDTPGAADQTGFRGHPECGFCRQRFYGDDELYAHCRDKHEKCHVCDRRDQGRRPQYFLNYEDLEKHFRKDHFLCPDSECMEKKFVVFESEIDLKAHQLEAHPNGLSKDALRDARRVDLGQFQDLRERYHPGRGGRDGRGGRRDRDARDDRDGRGRGRGRDPNAEPIPASSAQPMSRAELAYQRQMAVQSSSSTNSRSFGGQLTTPSPAEAYAARAPDHAPTAMSGPQRPTDSFPSVTSLRTSLEASTPSRSPAPFDEHLSPQEQARRMRHQAVVERATNMLGGDQPRLAEFRTKTSQFKNSQTTAAELVEFFLTLFDRPSAEVGSLIKELADIFEIQSKRDDLLKAWNDWRAINENYPSLPGGSSSASAAGSSVGGKRVLKLKTSTAQSARSASGAGRGAGWNTSAAASNLFPALPPARMNGGRPSGAPKTPWAGATPSVPRSSAPLRTTAPTRAPAPSNGADMFPALPAAARPLPSLFNPTGRAILRNTPVPGGAAASAWGTAGQAANGDSAQAAQTDAVAEQGRKKGKQGKKQVLLQFG